MCTGRVSHRVTRETWRAGTTKMKQEKEADTRKIQKRGVGNLKDSMLIQRGKFVLKIECLLEQRT